MLSNFDYYLNSVFNENFHEARLNRYIKSDLGTIYNESLMNIDHKKNDDGSLTFTVNVPGIKEEDLSVEVSSKRILNIKGHRKTLVSSEVVERNFSIPDEYDADTVRGDLKDGVLTFTILKKNKNKESRKVAITTYK